MAENSAIQWTNHTFNPWVGCAKVHEGCAHCYAEELMATRYHRVVWGVNGTRSKTKTWKDPLRWNREAGAAGVRARVFCASLADVFEDRSELRPWRAELFRLIDITPNLDWLLLTKRPENIGDMWHAMVEVDSGGHEWGKSVPTQRRFRRDNVWLGTSISNQKTADEWVPRLLKSRDLASVLFLSAEPLLSPVNLRDCGAIASNLLGPVESTGIDWVIVGGESDQGRNRGRPFDLEWARSLIGECRGAGIGCFVKQLGSYQGKLMRLKDAHGGDMPEWPGDLRVREFPAVRTVEAAR